MKPRSDSALFKLSEDQQAQVHDWLVTVGYLQTQKNVAASPPDGFGLKTHFASLHRFFVRYTQEHQQENFAQAAELLQTNSGYGDPNTLKNATEQAVVHSAFHLATSPQDSEAFGRLTRWLAKQKKLELTQEYLALARQRLALEREKFECNVAALALEHADALQPIADDTKLDDAAKIRRARERVFGPNLPD
jgi:hypothetical protein